MNHCEEREKLKKIWEASSDYLMGLQIPQFANVNGGILHLLETLKEAVSDYENEEPR
jgi:hypothetical protein